MSTRNDVNETVHPDGRRESVQVVKDTTIEVNYAVLQERLAQLLRDRDAAKATIAAGRTALTPVRTRVAQPATAAGLLQVQNDLKTVANALDGLAAIDLGVIDYVAALARLIVNDLTST